MKKLFFTSLFMAVMVTATAQISITSDSLVTCKWDITKGSYIPVKTVKENMAIDIDKDLLAIRVSGKTQDRAYIEQAFLIDFREMNNNAEKWLFNGSDKYGKLYTVTIDIPRKRVSFITTGKEIGDDTPLDMFYYSIADININLGPINKHLMEKGNK
jgi:hypothetical protein